MLKYRRHEYGAGSHSCQLCWAACAAVSVIRDECDPENLQPLNIADIIEVAGKLDENLSSFFAETINY